jgi:ATP-binding cassette, subfamily F, member 3
MNLLSLTNVSLALGAKSLFQNLSLCIEAGSRIALVGANGSGKSTLMRIMAGTIEPDDGQLAKNRSLRIGYVEQFLSKELASLSVRECIVAPWRDSFGIEPYDYRVDLLLDQLQIDSSLGEQPMHTLSGGETNRVLLGQALIANPNLLLLDEPTNHLDLPGIALFEEILSSLEDIALCIISHDRALLDRCTTETIFLRDGQLHHYRLPFSKARVALAEADEALVRQRQAQDAEIERLQKSAQQLKRWAAAFGNEKFAYRAKSIEKRIERKAAAAVVLPATPRATLKLNSHDISAKELIEIQGLSLVLGDTGKSLTIPSLRVRKSDRIAIIGENGTGKTSLIRAIFQASRDGVLQPAIRINPQVTIGYYDQELTFDCSTLTVLEYLTNVSSKPLTLHLRSELHFAGFDTSVIHRRITSLSGGEKARLKLLGIKISKPSLYILDEPTNHVDIRGIEQLEQELIDGQITTLFVSHDRAFIEHVATAVVEIRAGVAC